jgi:hypothetical protein
MSNEVMTRNSEWMNHIVNHLNQLTKLSHQRGFHETHVFVVDLLRRLKAILGEYRQASYKPKPSGIGRKEDAT